MKQPAIYIMTNKPHGTLYTGVTSNLVKRVFEHKNHLTKGFTNKYNLTSLVYFASIDSIVSAIEREKQIKGGSRRAKIALIDSKNPHWIDLYPSLLS